MFVDFKNQHLIYCGFIKGRFYFTFFIAKTERKVSGLHCILLKYFGFSVKSKVLIFIRLYRETINSSQSDLL